MLRRDGKIGEYFLVEKCGSGGFGEVWRAERRTRLSVNEFALKFFRPKDTDAIDIVRVQREIETWKRVSGLPNVVSIFEADIYEDYVYIVSEFADGGSLENWLKANGGRARSVKQAIQITQGILKGLESLHGCGFVHRDLKPANVLIKKGVPCLADFGISREMKTHSKATSTAGTYEYMPPEAFQKKPSVSVHTDIWSVGVILQRLLTGELPFPQDEIPSLITAILYNDPEPLPANIPAELHEIVTRCLQKDREKRFQSARKIRHEVEKVLHKSRVETIEGARPKESVEESVWTQPVIDLTDDFGQLSEEISEETLKDETERIKTQPEIESVAETQPSPMAETIDAWEIEREKQQEQERRFAQISEETDKKREKHRAQQRKRNFRLAGGIGAAVLGFSAIVFLIILMNGNNLNQAAANSVKTSPTNILTAETNGEASSSVESKNTKPTAPPKMVLVEGGSFVMGRDDGKSEAEKPAHKVTVKPFFMDVYETTNEDYAEFVKAKNYRQPAEWKNGTFPNGQAKFPVVGVDWNDAVAYCKYAEKRLPTEEEWEFAARGANNFLYPWGNEWKSGNANADGVNQFFTEVGKFKGTSPFGLYDMIGNAWEWTSSDFAAYPNGKLPDSFAGKQNLKTIRGGGFDSAKEFATTTYRLGRLATGAENYSGTSFRCASDVK